MLFHLLIFQFFRICTGEAVTSSAIIKYNNNTEIVELNHSNTNSTQLLDINQTSPISLKPHNNTEIVELNHSNTNSTQLLDINQTSPISLKPQKSEDRLSKILNSETPPDDYVELKKEDHALLFVNNSFIELKQLLNNIHNYKDALPVFKEKIGELDDNIKIFLNKYDDLKTRIYDCRMSELVNEESFSSPIKKKESTILDKVKKKIKNIFSNAPVKETIKLSYDLQPVINEILSNIIDIHKNKKKIQELFLMCFVLYEYILLEVDRLMDFSYEVECITQYENTELFNAHKKELYLLLEEYKKYICYYEDITNPIYKYLCAYREFLNLELHLAPFKIDKNNLQEKINTSYTLESAIYFGPQKKYEHYSCNGLRSKENYWFTNIRDFILCFFFQNTTLMEESMDKIINKHFILISKNTYNQENILAISTIIKESLRQTLKMKDKMDTSTQVFTELYVAIENHIKEPLNLTNIQKYTWYLENAAIILCTYYKILYRAYKYNKISLEYFNFDKDILDSINIYATFLEKYLNAFTLVNQNIYKNICVKNIEVFLMLHYAQLYNGYTPILLFDICYKRNTNTALGSYYCHMEKIIKSTTESNIDISKTILYYETKYLYSSEDIKSFYDPLYYYSYCVVQYYDNLPSFIQLTLSNLLVVKNMIFDWPIYLTNLSAMKTFTQERIQNIHQIDSKFQIEILSNIKENLVKYYWNIFYVLSIIGDKLSLDPSFLTVSIIFDCYNIIYDTCKNHSKYYDIQKILDAIVSKLYFYHNYNNKDNLLNILKIFADIFYQYYNEEANFQYEVVLYYYNLHLISTTEKEKIPVLPDIIVQLTLEHKVGTIDYLNIVELFNDFTNLDIITKISTALQLQEIHANCPLIMGAYGESSIAYNSFLTKILDLSFFLMEEYMLVLKSYFYKKNSENEVLLNTFLTNSIMNDHYDKILKIILYLNKIKIFLIDKIRMKLENYYNSQDTKNIVFFQDIEVILSARVNGSDVKIMKAHYNFYFNGKKKIKQKNINIKSNEIIEYTNIGYYDYLQALFLCLEKYENYAQMEQKRLTEIARNEEMKEKKRAQQQKDKEQKNRIESEELKTIINISGSPYEEPYEDNISHIEKKESFNYNNPMEELEDNIVEEKNILQDEMKEGQTVINGKSRFDINNVPQYKKKIDK